MGLLKFLSRNADPAEAAACDNVECSAVQTARPVSHPFHDLDGYIPLSGPERRLYASIREAVPIIDAAISKIVRLVGGFQVKCDDDDTTAELKHFLDTVQVGSTGIGINAFLDTYLDQLITFGTAVGEIVPSCRRDTIGALYNVPLHDIEIIKNGPLQATVCRREDGRAVPVKYQSLILLSALNPEPGSAYGTSLLRSLPFVSAILLKIFNTIGMNFERFGNLRYAVTYKPETQLDKAAAKNRAMQIAQEWASAMQPGSVKDFISVGDVQIRVIGSDNQILDSSVPVKHMMEQIVAKTGIPPFMLGLSWSTTEKMSSQQADILTSELEAYRRMLSPIIHKICDIWLRLNGHSSEISIEWDNINLQDEVEMARAQLLAMQAREIEEKISETEDQTE